MKSFKRIVTAVAFCLAILIFLAAWAGGAAGAAENQDYDCEPATQEYQKKALSAIEESLLTEADRLHASPAAIIADSYIVESSNGKFYLRSSNGISSGYNSLSELLDIISENSLLNFSDVVSDEALLISKPLTLSGTLTLTGQGISSESQLMLNRLNLTLKEGSLRVKSGSLTVCDSRVDAYGESALVLDYSSGARAELHSGSIAQHSARPAALVERGTLRICGGIISSEYSYAVKSLATLELSGSAQLSGYTYAVSTDNPIRLFADGIGFEGALSVIYEKDFAEGSFTPVFYGARNENIEDIALYDKTGERKELEYFEENSYTDDKSVLAVYLPYRAYFYIGSSLCFTSEHLASEALCAPLEPSLPGFRFLGWYLDELGENLYSFGSAPNKDIKLYGKFKLLPPEFSISSRSFTYDAEQHMLEFDSIYHPLMDSGSFSFDWFKDGISLGISSASLPLLNVCDSGRYHCRLTFSYNGDFITVQTPTVSVEILKKQLTPPEIAEKEYTSYRQTADVPKSHLYSIVNEGGEAVGEYPVILSLSDYDNYAWEGNDVRDINIVFRIVKTKNYFLSAPTVKNGYEGIGPSFSASSYFGVPVYVFSNNIDGPWSESVPKAPGVYYFKTYVSECNNYYYLASEVISFRILEEEVIGIGAESFPYKSSYIAFERLVLDGASFYASYNSGRKSIIPISELTVKYPSGNCLVVGDSSVSMVYGEYSVPIPVSVERASYDVSAIDFSSLATVYDGKRHTISANGTVVGLDGIPLEYKTLGGGTDAGEYQITLKFICSSPNYDTPPSITKTLTVLPMEISIEYESLSFVYDKKPKIPRGSIMLAEGLRIWLSFSGAATDAGVYTAVAEYSNPNYKLVNPEVEYEILKADLDLSGVSWQGEEFVYSGSPVVMSVSELPQGVSVIGYVNGSFSEVGEYKTEAGLLYDERNYNPPGPLYHNWRIIPAEYDFSDFSFLDSSFVYDGEAHYPTASGAIPSGADGSSPRYEFSTGVTNVAEGRVRVEIRYLSDSKNYNAPPVQYAYVEILPMPIYVSWSNLVMTYNGGAQIPLATSESCSVSVLGFGIDAGEYVATAIPVSSNYTVINSSVIFKIEKCDNSWLIYPSITNIYYGTKPSAVATALYGTVKFAYYKDSELTEPVDAPAEPGEYYMVASVEEGKNYKSLKACALRFEIIPILPVGLKVNLNGFVAVAMEHIRAGSFEVYTLNNNGSVSLIPYSEVKISYQSGAVPLYRDSYITVEANGFKLSVPIEIKKAEYDMSGAIWEGCRHVYDGTEKLAYLTGLPHGVSIVGYRLNSAVDAGSYKLCAILSYDSENYLEPRQPDSHLIIEKQKILIPELLELEYDGSIKSPDFENHPLYTVHVTEGVGAGWYKVTYCLRDSSNYLLVDGSGVYSQNGILESGFLIAKRQITLKVLPSGKEYEIVSGSLAKGDSLEAEYYTEDGYIYLRCDNSNYDITVIPAKDNRVSRTLMLWLIVFIAVFIFALACFGTAIRRGRLQKIALAVGECLALSEGASYAFLPERSILSIDEVHAQALISDDGAKSLIRYCGEKILTQGKRRVIVNLDTISDSFSENDVVDINSMKEKGIIPSDALSVKILARGVIDKPLTVKANAFSLSAVKMIALTGGTSIKCKTERKR